MLHCVHLERSFKLDLCYGGTAFRGENACEELPVELEGFPDPW